MYLLYLNISIIHIFAKMRKTLIVQLLSFNVLSDLTNWTRRGIFPLTHQYSTIQHDALNQFAFSLKIWSFPKNSAL